MTRGQHSDRLEQLVWGAGSVLVIGYALVPVG
jgi:hypothetical protein